jgi:hypothetical protein
VTRIASGKAQTAAGLDTRRGFATPHEAILVTTLREGLPKRATRRCIACPHASAGGALRLVSCPADNWHIDEHTMAPTRQMNEANRSASFS